jgi:Family of unknown function (DUF6011)
MTQAARFVAEEITAPESPRRQFNAAEDAYNFILGEKATFTVVSKATGVRFTYKVNVSDQGRDLFFVSVLTGPDNTSNFTYLGTLRHEYAPGTSWTWKHGIKSPISADAPSAKGFAWLWANLKQGKLPATAEFWHEGRCCRCNRKLTVPSSIESGIGPECAGRARGNPFRVVGAS